MDREALRALDKAASTELVVELCARLEALEAELARLRRPTCPPNSSIPPTACRGCGTALPAAGQRRVRRSQAVKLPEVGPLIISRPSVRPPE
jgi:hypothetical protein